MKEIEAASNILRIDEGFRSSPYYDHKRFPTIGYGFRIPGTKKNDPLPPITIGRNEAEKMLKSKIVTAIKQLSNNDFLAVWSQLNAVRKAVLISMAFQLGITGLRNFKKMTEALESLDYQRASEEIIDSAAWRDPLTRDRFTRNAEMMITGEILDYYK